jgi:cell wall-associated NlpC family hydrolase
MQPARVPTACGSKCALCLLIAGLFAWAAVPPVAAQTKSKKKPAAVEAATPKKKASPTATPKTTPDKNKDDAVASDSNSGAEPKKKRATISPANSTKSEAKPGPSPSAKLLAAPNAAIAPEEIMEFHAQPAGVRKLIESSLDLARQNLTYTFGSADPANGGMDCSGFIYYVLRQHGFTEVPRDVGGLYVWMRKAHGFRAVISRKPDSFEMDELLPGDLLFWIGTYATEHDPPVTHTMIYLGTEKASGAKIMVGSSDGRTYHGQKRNGVGVFDFIMPRTPIEADPRSTFIGYARIPGLRD